MGAIAPSDLQCICTYLTRLPITVPLSLEIYVGPDILVMDVTNVFRNEHNSSVSS